MKRRISLALVLSMLVCMLQTGIAFAAPVKSEELVEGQIISSTKEYLEDGSYIIKTLVVYDDASAISGENTVLGTATSITASQTTTRSDSSGNKLCALKVTGTFSYDGNTVSCVSKSYNTYSYNSDWKVEDVSTSTGGAGSTKAYAKATGKGVHRVLGIPIQSASISAAIYCTNKGEISC